MKTIGTFTSCRSSFTNAKILSVVMPPRNALKFAPWITGPSAVGSENGIPSSIRSAPFSTAARTTFAVVSRSGSPQVTNAINAFPFSNALFILLMDILPSVAGNGCAVLVASAGNSNDNDFILIHRRCKLHCVSNRMC